MAGIEGESRCTLCRAPIWWRLTIGGRRFPLDAEPNPAGNVIVVELPGGLVRARVLTGAEMPAQQEAFKVHECPRPTRPGPPCSVCRLPMNRELAIQLRWTTHPACDLTYQRDLAELGLAATRKKDGR